MECLERQFIITDFFRAEIFSFTIQSMTSRRSCDDFATWTSSELLWFVAFPGEMVIFHSTIVTVIRPHYEKPRMFDNNDCLNWNMFYKCPWKPFVKNCMELTVWWCYCMKWLTTDTTAVIVVEIRKTGKVFRRTAQNWNEVVHNNSQQFSSKSIQLEGNKITDSMLYISYL